MYQCLKGSYLFRFNVGQSMPGLSVPLMYPSISPYLSPMLLESLVMGWPLFSFLNCSYRIKPYQGLPLRV